MGVDASPEPQTALEAVTELSGAPQGWHKKLLPKKAGTPRRRDVVFIAPTGEEIRSKAQLERHLKANPGGPALSDFVWSTGDTPRRSGRLSAKTRLSTDSTESEPSDKRAKRATPEKHSKENEEIETNPSPSENEKENKNRTGMKEPVKDFKEDEHTENKILEDEPVKDFKEDEHSEIIQPKEGLRKRATGENEDIEMKDAVPVTDILENTVVFIDNDSKSNKESIIEVQEEEKCGQKLQQEVGLQAAAADGAKETDKVVEFTESKKDASLGHFVSAEAHKADEHVENVHSEADLGKPQLTPYFGVAKPQEAHPSEVGVSS